MTMMMPTNPVSIDRPVKERIVWAESVYRECGEFLLENDTISELLCELKDAAQVSSDRMNQVGVVALCRECDREEGGSCCGKGLENKYDVWLLLINRLSGVDLPRTRKQPEGCFFLGGGGCLLKARHVICINYLCQKITDNVLPAKLNDLRKVEGREISALFVLKEQVKRLAKKWMITQKEP